MTQKSSDELQLDIDYFEEQIREAEEKLSQLRTQKLLMEETITKRQRL